MVSDTQIKHEQGFIMRARTALSRAVGKIKREGLLKFTGVVIHIVWRHVYLNAWVNILYRDLQAPIPEILPKIDIEIKKIEGDAIIELKDTVDRARYLKFENRLTKGKAGFVALVGGRIVCYVWISFQDEYEPFLGMNIELNQENGYIYDTYVIPEFRRKGINSAVCNRALEYIKSRGYKGALTAVGGKNIPSIRTFKKLGFVEYEVFRIIRIFGIRFRSSVKSQGERSHC